MLWRVEPAHSLTLAIGGLTLAVIAFGRVPGARLSRAAVAFVGAAALLAVQAVELDAAVRMVNGEVLLLLFSLMVVNANLASAGAFRLLATLVTRGTLGPRRLLALLVLSAGVLSALFLNDTVVLMLTPLVVRAARRLRLPPLPYLLGLALAANAGSVATVTGNPQNVLVAVGAGIGYGEFAARLGPVALLALAVTLGVLLVAFRRELRGGRLVVAEAATAGAVASADVAGATAGAGVGTAAGAGAGADVGAAAGPAPLPQVQRGRLLVSGAAALLMLAGFVAGVPVAVAAAVAAALLLTSHGRGASLILKRVDYELLVLFAGLFVVVGAIAATGLPERWLLGLLGAGGGAAGGLVGGPVGGQLGGALGSTLGGAAAGQVATGPAGLGALTAVTAALSTLVSNVPAVLVLLPALALPTLAPPAGTTLGLTVAMAATLAGNLTLMASVANLIVAESARRLGEEVGFWAYLRVGVPVTLLSLLLGWLYLAFAA